MRIFEQHLKTCSQRRAAPLIENVQNRVLVTSDFVTRRRGYYPHSGPVCW